MSEDEKPEGTPVFYYNRQRRLENGPEEVRRAYAQGLPKGGLVHVLVANKALRSIFFAILILFGVIVATTFLDRSTNATAIDGIPIVVKAFSFEDLVYISCIVGTEATAQEGIEPIAIIAQVSAVDVNGAVIGTRELAGVYSGRKLVMRATMADYEINTVSVVVKIDKTERILYVSVDRN